MPAQYRYRRVHNVTLISTALYDVLPDGTKLIDMDGGVRYKGKPPLDTPPDYRGRHKITWVGFPARTSDPYGEFAARYRQQ